MFKGMIFDETSATWMDVANNFVLNQPSKKSGSPEKSSEIAASEPHSDLIKRENRE